MYFSEQGNVDDDATIITIFFVSFNLQSCCLMQSAVCGLRSAVCGLRSAVCGLQSAVCKCHTPPGMNLKMLQWVALNWHGVIILDLFFTVIISNNLTFANKVQLNSYYYLC